MPKGVKAVFHEGEGRKYTNRKGETRYALNQEQRGRKYAQELSTGCDAITGEKLSNTQKAYRSGFLKDRQINAQYYNYHKSKEAEKSQSKKSTKK